MTAYPSPSTKDQYSITFLDPISNDNSYSSRGLQGSYVHRWSYQISVCLTRLSYLQRWSYIRLFVTLMMQNQWLSDTRDYKYFWTEECITMQWYRYSRAFFQLDFLLIVRSYKTYFIDRIGWWMEIWRMHIPSLHWWKNICLVTFVTTLYQKNSRLRCIMKSIKIGGSNSFSA